MVRQSASRRYRIAVWTGLVLLAVLLGAFLYRVRAILTPFFLAFVLAYLLEPPVTELSRLGLPRSAAILIVYAVVGLVLASVFVYVVPATLAELNRLGQNLPVYTGQVQGFASNLQARYHRAAMPEGLRVAIDQAILGVQRGIQEEIHTAVGIIMGLFKALFSILIAPIIAFYLLKDLDYFKARFVASIPRKWRSEVLALMAELNAVIGGFVRGQLLVASAVGVMAAGAMVLLRLKFASIVGIVAGLAEIIPYFGPVLGAIPAVALGLMISPLKAVQVIVAFALIQQIENGVIGPMVIGDRVGLHPLAVIFAILAGGLFAGIWGMLLAVPVAGFVKVISSFGYRQLLSWRESKYFDALTRPDKSGIMLPTNEAERQRRGRFIWSPPSERGTEGDQKH